MSFLSRRRWRLIMVFIVLETIQFSSLTAATSSIWRKCVRKDTLIASNTSPFQKVQSSTGDSLKSTTESKQMSVTEEYENVNGALRAAKFWKGSIEMYTSYKKMQFVEFISNKVLIGKISRTISLQNQWDHLHEINSDKMLAMCLELGGFYLKFGQFLGTRHDFMPEPFTRKLRTLQDSVPPISASEVKRVVEQETGSSVSEIFQSLQLECPVGSASISQVHKGVLAHSGTVVAVKVQYPGAEKVMAADLANLRKACAYLTKFELNFDLASVVGELQKQLTFEFDFNLEGRNMNMIGSSLSPVFGRSIVVPQSLQSTKRLLIMSYVDGIPLSRLNQHFPQKKISQRVRKKICHKLLSKIAHAYGYMIFKQGIFHADPHPGNILVLPGLNIGLLDWGQTKSIDQETKIKFAKLVRAMSQKNETDIVKRFFELGVKLEKPEDIKTAHNIAVTMFDTRNIPGYAANPFDKNNGLKTNAVKVLPPDLYFMLRSVQILKGISYGMGIDFHLSQIWDKYTAELLMPFPGPC